MKRSMDINLVMKKNKLVKTGDKIVVTCGDPYLHEATNLIKIIEV